MKITIQETQIALMFQTSFTGSFDGILSSYKNTYPQTTGSKIPLPDDFPEDSIPRLEINHIDRNIVVRFAKSRADIFFNSVTVDEGILSDFFDRVIDLGITVGRVGYVQKNIYSDIDLSYVRSKLPMLGVTDEDEEILEAMQRINKKTVVDYDGGRLDCNNIATLTFGKPDGKPALLLGRDVNTKQDKNLSLKKAEELEVVVDLLKVEAEKTLFEMR